MKLSVVIITKNEEDNIERCLKSITFADECIVVDDKSSDKTVGIVREFTDKIFIREMQTFGEQKQFGVEKAQGDWILLMDADEEITPPLKEEILQKISSKEADAYHLYFRETFLGKTMHFKKVGGCVRLFRKGLASYRSDVIHEKLAVKGTVGELENPIVHHSFRSIEQIIDKFNRYSTLESNELYKTGYKTGPVKMCVASLNAVAMKYLRHEGYKDGLEGIMLAMLFGFLTASKHLKIMEHRMSDKERPRDVLSSTGTENKEKAE